MNSSQEDLFEDAGKSFNQRRISDVGAASWREEKCSDPACAATVYASKQKFRLRFSQSTLELELSVTEGTPRLANYDLLVSSLENSGVHSGSLTVLLPEEDSLAAGACFTATLLKVSNLPAADTRESDSNEVTVSAHLLSALHGEAVQQAYLFGALDGCIYSCRISEGLKFTRLASFPSPARALALLVVLPDVDGHEADATEGQSSEVELLVGVSVSGWLLSLHFLLKQRHLRFFRLPRLPTPEKADISCRVAGPWLHLLSRPSGCLLSLFFSLSARSTVVRCWPAPFPRYPPRPIPPLLDPVRDTLPPPALDLGIERNASQIQRAFCWRETSIEGFVRMPDGHIGALLKDGSTHRLADYCLYSLEKQEDMADTRGLLSDRSIFTGAECGRFLSLYESTLAYLLGNERLEFLDAGVELSLSKAAPSGQVCQDLDLRIEIKLVRPGDGGELVASLDSLTPPELLFEILSSSTRSLRPESDPLLIRLADLFSIQIEVHDSDVGSAFPWSESDDTPFIYSSTVLTQTEPWNAAPLVRVSTTVSESCTEFIRQVKCPAEHLLDLTNENPRDQGQEVVVFLQLSPAPFRSLLDSTATQLDQFALKVPLRRQLLRRQIGVLDWLRPLPPSQRTGFPSDSWLSLPLRLRTAQALDVILAVINGHLVHPQEGQKVGFKTVNICMQHHYLNTPVNFLLQSFGDLQENEEYNLLLSSPSAVALWSVHSALRKRLDEHPFETVDVVDIEELKDELAALKALEVRLTGHLEDTKKFEEDPYATQTLLNAFAFLRNSQISNCCCQCQD